MVTSSIRWRKSWLIAHRWVGLTVGLLLTLTGLTGTLLVFRSTLDQQLNPNIFATEIGDGRCSVEEILSAARSCSVAEKGKISFVDFPKSDQGVWTVWFQTGTKAAPQLTKTYFDPFSARMTGQRIHGQDLMTWIYDLHVKLFAGHSGETIVGFAGIVLMFSIASGVVLWWPLWRHSWRSALAIRRGTRFVYDLHKMGGIVIAPFLLIMAFTGVYLTFPTWIAPGIRVLFAEPARSESRFSSSPQEGGARISADRAIEIVQNQFPNALIRRIHPPSNPEGTYIVRFCQVGDVHRSLGGSRAWVDQYRGEVLGARDLSQRSAADAFISWQLPLHNGEAFGLTGRWLVFTTGMMPAVLYVTGFCLWWRRPRTRHQQRHRDEISRLNSGEQS